MNRNKTVEVMQALGIVKGKYGRWNFDFEEGPLSLYFRATGKSSMWRNERIMIKRNTTVPYAA